MPEIQTKATTYTPANVFHMQRTEAGLDFERKLKKLRAEHARGEPEAVNTVREVTEYLRALRGGNREKAGVTAGSVHSNGFLSNFSLAYNNDEFIAERVLPVVMVDHLSDNYATYGQRDRLGVMDDSVGSRGTVNEVTESRGVGTYLLAQHALQNSIDAVALTNQDPVFDEMLDLLESVNAGIGLAREVRAAAVVQTTSNYAGNTATLSGSSQWNSSTGGDPLKNIQDGVAALWGGVGMTDIIGVTNLEAYNALTRHPAVLDLLKYTQTGLVTKQQLASILGLSDIYVGAARKETANIGIAASYSRVWADSFSILRVSRRPTKRSAHFGATFRMKGHPVTTQWFEENLGLAGRYFAKVGVAEVPAVVSGLCGYIFADVLAS